MNENIQVVKAEKNGKALKIEQLPMIFHYSLLSSKHQEQIYSKPNLKGNY